MRCHIHSWSINKLQKQFKIFTYSNLWTSVVMWIVRFVYRRSSFIRCNSFSALYGISLVVAMFSATLNWADRCTLNESCNEYLMDLVENLYKIWIFHCQKVSFCVYDFCQQIMRASLDISLSHWLKKSLHQLSKQHTEKKTLRIFGTLFQPGWLIFTNINQNLDFSTKTVHGNSRK